MHHVKKFRCVCAFHPSEWICSSTLESLNDLHLFAEECPLDHSIELTTDFADTFARFLVSQAGVKQGATESHLAVSTEIVLECLYLFITKHVYPSLTPVTLLMKVDDLQYAFERLAMTELAYVQVDLHCIGTMACKLVEFSLFFHLHF